MKFTKIQHNKIYETIFTFFMEIVKRHIQKLVKIWPQQL